MQATERAQELGEALAAALAPLYRGRLTEREHRTRIDELYGEYQDVIKTEEAGVTETARTMVLSPEVAALIAAAEEWAAACGVRPWHEPEDALWDAVQALRKRYA